MSEGLGILTTEDQMRIANYRDRILADVDMPSNFYDDLGWTEEERLQQFRTTIYNRIYECVEKILSDRQKTKEKENG